MTFGFFKTKVHSTRHYVIVMAFAVVLVGLAYFAEPYIRGYLSGSSTESISELNQGTAQKNDFRRSAPVRLVIPSINLDTTFVQPLGLLPDQTVSVPDSYTEVGWYSGGVSPGEVGPSVILGHVDSIDGPAIFYSLGQIKIDDEIEVIRADGTTAIFTVTKLERHPQSNFPTMDVYGPTDEAVLRLVTCTGAFNKGEQRYSHNLVVFASLKSTISSN